MDYVLERLKESSTWRGVIYVATALGCVLTTEQQTAIITAGMALAGLLAVFFPDKKKGPE